MRVRVINPNTTAGMTAKIGDAARRVAAPGTTITAVNPKDGPASIEGHYDEAMAVPGLLAEVLHGEREGTDGHVIACFGDPGLLAAREIARGPVVGVAEAAMHAASLVATGFSIVTTMKRTCVIAEHLVARYGMAGFCRGVRGTDVPVLDLEDAGSDARRIIVEECRRAVAEDRAGAIVLGCAGMADLAAEVEEAVGVPAIDGVAAAVKLVEALVGMGLRTSKRGDLAFPLPKVYAGRLAPMAPGEGRGLRPSTPPGVSDPWTP